MRHEEGAVAMRLHHWSRARKDVEFDPATGAATVIALAAPRSGSEAALGFAEFERALLGARQIFAVFRDGDSVVFSAGAKRWALDRPGLRLVHSRRFPFLSRFRVWEDERLAFSITYLHLGRLLVALLDPTYDKLDQDSDFFLEFVAEHAGSSEWRAHVLEQWAPGSAT